MANYLHRLAAIEERMGANGCGRGRCVKCLIAQLPIVEGLGGERLARDSVACDGHPMTLLELLTTMDAGCEPRFG